jgi:hypothetical protein
MSPEIWTREIASPAIDFAGRVAVAEDGDVIVGGTTGGDIGADNQGGQDVFIRRFDADGAVEWTTQFGSPPSPFVSGLHVNAAGEVFAAGSTELVTFSPPMAKKDIYLTKFAANGVRLWTKQVETPGFEHALSLAADSNGEMFVSSSDSETPLDSPKASIRKFDAEGSLLWTRTLSAPLTGVNGAGTAVDNSGYAYLVGQVDSGAQLSGSSSTGGAFVSKFNANGDLQWTKQFGLPDSSAWDIAVDASNNFYVTGTDRSFNSGYLKKFDDAGALIWTVLFGGGTTASTLNLDEAGNLFVGGYVAANAPFFAMVQTDGTMVWTREYEYGSGYHPDVAGDGMGHVFVFNTIQVSNSFDTLLVKASIVPEPGAGILCGAGLVAFYGRVRPRLQTQQKKSADAQFSVIGPEFGDKLPFPRASMHAHSVLRLVRA